MKDSRPSLTDHLLRLRLSFQPLTCESQKIPTKKKSADTRSYFVIGLPALLPPSTFCTRYAKRGQNYSIRSRSGWTEVFAEEATSSKVRVTLHLLRRPVPDQSSMSLSSLPWCQGGRLGETISHGQWHSWPRRSGEGHHQCVFNRTSASLSIALATR